MSYLAGFPMTCVAALSAARGADVVLMSCVNAVSVSCLAVDFMTCMCIASFLMTRFAAVSMTCITVDFITCVTTLSITGTTTVTWAYIGRGDFHEMVIAFRSDVIVGLAQDVAADSAVELQRFLLVLLVEVVVDETVEAGVGDGQPLNDENQPLWHVGVPEAEHHLHGAVRYPRQVERACDEYVHFECFVLAQLHRWLRAGG